MRLIDADRLIKGFKDHEFIDTHFIWNAPTVDAIPEKWLKDRVRLLRDCGSDLLAESLEAEIALWRTHKRMRGWKE